ncbi:hypothetical protein PLICRDRAFT_170944 [Plicaturopsis crispa FD-325 SS-3]|nr:hypothetical protein PLICRDRAFT_170944 [Plicaturopsis crispa FD-325 SS-3]
MAPTPPMSNINPLEQEDPPRYEDAPVPIVPLTYQFSPLAGTNSMILVPPATVADTRPKYHISVSMNCFIPSSYITTIRRGGTENGEEVGDFETGKSANVGTVCIRGSEAILSSALIFARNYVVSDNSTWYWRYVQNPLCWQWQKTGHVKSATCYRAVFAPNSAPKRSDVVLAKFTPRTLLRKHGVAPQMAELTVMPEGQKYFDHIVISILAVERTRLTPGGDHAHT